MSSDFSFNAHSWNDALFPSNEGTVILIVDGYADAILLLVCEHWAHNLTGFQFSSCCWTTGKGTRTGTCG